MRKILLSLALCLSYGQEIQDVYVNEGVIFPLERGDADLMPYKDGYALLPKSQALRLFLHQSLSDASVPKASTLDTRTLTTGSSTTQIHNQGIEV